MATNEEILVRMSVDTASIDKADAKIKEFRDKVNTYLNAIKVGLDLKGLTAGLADVKLLLTKLSKDASKIATVNIKVAVDSKSLATSLAQIKSFAAVANAALALKVTPAGSVGVPATAGGQPRKPTAGGQPPSGAGGGSSAAAAASGAAKAAKSVRDYGTALDITTRSYFGFVSAQQTGRAIIDPVIKSFAEYEDRLLRVGRVLGITGEELADFGEKMTKIATSLGVSRNALLDLAGAAARVGVGKKDIESFVIQTQKIAIALEMAGTETAAAFRSFQLLFKLDTTQLTAVANVFNKVADSSAISAQALVGFLQYLGPVANQFDILGAKGVSAMTAISALLGEMGISAEVTGSGMTRIFQTLVNNTEKAARIAGVSAEEFRQAMSVDMLQALNMLLTGYKKLDVQQKQTAKTMLKLGNIRVERVFELLANNVDTLAQKQAIANTAFKDGISVETEVAKQLGGLTSQYQQTLNTIEAVAVKGLAPLVQKIKDTMFAIREWIAENPVLAEQLSNFIVLFGALVGGLGTAAVALFGVIQLITTFATVITSLVPLVKSLTLSIDALNVATSAASIGAWFKGLSATVAGAAAFGQISKTSATLVLAIHGIRTALTVAGATLAKFALIAGKFVAIPLLIAANIEYWGSQLLGLESQTLRFFTWMSEENAPERTAEQLAEAAAQTKNLTKEFSAADKEAAKLTTTTQKLDNNIKLIGTKKQGVDLAAQFREARAAMEGTRFAAGKDFAEALGPDLQKKFAQLLANGAQPLKQELEKMVFIMRTTLPDGADKAAKKLAGIADSLNRTLNAKTTKGIADKFKADGAKKIKEETAKALEKTELGKIALDLTVNGSKNIDQQLASLLSQLTAIAEQAKEIGGEEGKQLNIAALAAVNKVLEESAGSSSIYRDRLLALKESFGGNLQSAEEFLDSLKNINVQYTDKQGITFINALKEVGGTAERGVVLFKALSQSVVDFNAQLGPTLIEQYGDKVGALAVSLTGVKSEAELLGIALEKGFTGVDLSRIAGAIKLLARRNTLDRELIDLRAEYNDLLDKGGGKLEKDIDRILEVKRATQALIKSQGFASDIQRESLQIQDALIEMYEEQLKKKKESAEEERRTESTAAKIEEFVARSVEHADKFALASEEGAAAIEKAVHKEEEHMRVLLRKATKAEDITRIRIAGERNIQLAIAATARAQVETARKALESINQKILDLRKSGEQILRGLEAEARPALSVVEQARDQLEKLIEAAEEGKFFGKENEARAKFEEKIARLREQALEENERKALEFIDRKYKAEEALADLRRQQEEDAFASRNFVEDLKKKRLADINSGTPTDEALAAERDEKRKRAEKQASLIRERQRAELDLENVNREGGRFFSSNPDIKNDLERMFRDMSVNFAKALVEGADKRTEMERQQRVASESLVEAANALKLAAAALLAGADPEANKKRVEADLNKQKAEKESKLVDIEGKAKTASEISEALNAKIKVYVAELLDQFAGKTKDAESIREFQKKKAEIIKKLGDEIEEKTKGTGIDFGKALTDGINELVNSVEFGASSATMPSTVREDLEKIELIEKNVADRISQEAIQLREELRKFGETYTNTMKLVEQDVASARALINKITTEAVNAGVEANKVIEKEGAKIGTPQKPAESPAPTPVETPATSETQSKRRNKYLGKSVEEQEAAAQKQKEAAEKMQTAANDMKSTAESRKNAEDQIDAAIKEARAREISNAVPPRAPDGEQEQEQEQIIAPREVSEIGEIVARSEQKLLEIPNTIADAMSFLGTMSALGGGKTTLEEESMRAFGMDIRSLENSIVVNTISQRMALEKTSLESIDANAEEAKKQTPRADDRVLDRVLNSLEKQSQQEPTSKQQVSGKDVSQLDIPDDEIAKLEADGGVAVEAAEQAGEDIGVLAETQGKNTDALTGLTDSLSMYVSKSTQQTADNTKAIRETQADLNAATTLLDALAMA